MLFLAFVVLFLMYCVIRCCVVAKQADLDYELMLAREELKQKK